MIKKINIVAVNIKSGGGLVLLNELISFIKKNKNYKASIFVDRNFLVPVNSKRIRFIKFHSYLNKLEIFFKSLNNVIYFGNIPPINPFGKSRVLYFHNTFYCQSSFTLIKRLQFKYLFHKIYIKLFLSNIDQVYTQTSYISDTFYNYFKVKSKLLPFFRNFDLEDYRLEILKFDFCYISLPSPAKNFENLFNALRILNNKQLKISIVLTVPFENHNLIDLISEFKNSYIQIFNVGIISHDEALKYMAKSKVIIFPSTLETFGLPLIEAAILNKVLIASDLPYVFEVVTPSKVFNPYDPKDISNCMQKSLKGIYPKSKMRIRNNINLLFDNL